MKYTLKVSHATKLAKNSMNTFTHRVVRTMNMSAALNTKIMKRVCSETMRGLFKRQLIALQRQKTINIQFLLFHRGIAKLGHLEHPITDGVKEVRKIAISLSAGSCQI